MTTGDYLDGEETTRRRELEYGIVREPPAPFYGHQAVITNLAVILAPQVRAHGLGRVCVSPIDVVFDAEKALVLQPDLVFVSTPRLGLVRNQIWGAPDLVVEVLSPGTTRRDRTQKLRWYEEYGVREVWLVDPAARVIDVIALESQGRRHRRRFTGRALVKSSVLTAVRIRTADTFA